MSAQAAISADLSALDCAVSVDAVPARRSLQPDSAPQFAPLLNESSVPTKPALTTHAMTTQALTTQALTTMSGQAANAQLTPPWLTQPVATNKSLFGKGGLLITVVAGHLAAFALLALAPSTPKQSAVAPMQVQLLSDPQAEQRNEPPPPVRLETFNMELPVEPLVIDMVSEANNAITVAVKSEPAQPSAEPVAQPKLVSSVEYVREPAAKYPPTARAMKQRGIVTLRALIDSQGNAREVNVHRSSGFRLLDDAARVAVLGALFKPYMENGRALPVYVLIPIEFGAG